MKSVAQQYRMILVHMKKQQLMAESKHLGINLHKFTARNKGEIIEDLMEADEMSITKRILALQQNNNTKGIGKDKKQQEEPKLKPFLSSELVQLKAGLASVQKAFTQSLIAKYRDPITPQTPKSDSETTSDEEVAINDQLSPLHRLLGAQDEIVFDPSYITADYQKTRRQLVEELLPSIPQDEWDNFMKKAGVKGQAGKPATAEDLLINQAMQKQNHFYSSLEDPLQGLIVARQDKEAEKYIARLLMLIDERKDIYTQTVEGLSTDKFNRVIETILRLSPSVNLSKFKQVSLLLSLLQMKCQGFASLQDEPQPLWAEVAFIKNSYTVIKMSLQCSTQMNFQQKSSEMHHNIVKHLILSQRIVDLLAQTSAETQSSIERVLLDSFGVQMEDLSASIESRPWSPALLEQMCSHLPQKVPFSQGFNNHCRQHLDTVKFMIELYVNSKEKASQDSVSALTGQLQQYITRVSQQQKPQELDHPLFVNEFQLILTLEFKSIILQFLFMNDASTQSIPNLLQYLWQGIDSQAFTPFTYQQTLQVLLVINIIRKYDYWSGLVKEQEGKVSRILQKCILYLKEGPKQSQDLQRDQIISVFQNELIPSFSVEAQSKLTKLIAVSF